MSIPAVRVSAPFIPKIAVSSYALPQTHVSEPLVSTINDWEDMRSVTIKPILLGFRFDFLNRSKRTLIYRRRSAKRPFDDKHNVFFVLEEDLASMLSPPSIATDR